MFEKSLPCYRRAFNGDNPKLATTLGNYGSALSWRSRIKEGTHYAGLGLEMARRLGDSNTLATCLFRYAQALNDWGKGSPKAVPYLREALDIRRAFGSNSPALASVLSRLSVSVTNDLEGIGFAREAIEISKAAEGYEPTNTVTAFHRFTLGQKLLDVGRPEDAETELRQALTLWRTIFDPRHPHREIVFVFLIESLAQQGKWSVAEAEIQTEAGLAAVGTDYCFALRAALQIRQGNWEQAFDLLRPSGANNVDTATALAFEGAVEEYRQQSRRILDKTPVGTNFAAMERASKTALLLPPEPSDLERAGKLADAVAQVQDSRAFAPWSSMTKSLAEYRRGNFGLAVEWSGRAISATNAELSCLAAARFIQALAYQRADQIQSARSALAAGKEVLEAFKVGGMGHDGVIRENGSLKGGWGVRDWQTAEILHREAEKLLSAPSASSKEQ
jgi:tetratricopeptide (TPR) repeat protein